MVPRAVLMKSGLVSVNIARQVNTAYIKSTVNAARPMSYLFKKAHSTVKRPIHKNTTFKDNNFNQRVLADSVPFLPLRKRGAFASPTPSHRGRGELAPDVLARPDGPAIARKTLISGVRTMGLRIHGMIWDRPVHRCLAVMIKREAKMAREAWGLSMDASDYARSDVMSLRTTIVAQSALTSELQSADHKRLRWSKPHRRSSYSEASKDPQKAPATCPDALESLVRIDMLKLCYAVWKGNDVVTYNPNVFQELALIVDRIFSKKEIDHDAMSSPLELMDKKINTWAETQARQQKKRARDCKKSPRKCSTGQFRGLVLNCGSRRQSEGLPKIEEQTQPWVYHLLDKWSFRIRFVPGATTRETGTLLRLAPSENEGASGATTELFKRTKGFMI
ncbi:hypothetical protein Tco_1131775 [Tanacetum coccineum]|uniref:Uncharacterized protein n=1 Tax=Tanacetum coccineum TaxID=301880 RepID=A0ABQ5JAM7_9ASTR